MKIYFITGNKNKYEEVKAVMPNVEQLDIDLPEIQSLDSQVVIKAKINEAFKEHSGEFIVEDNSLTIHGMNGLPGTLIKWFLKSIGNEGIVKLSTLFGADAEAKVVIGYAKNLNEIEFFEGIVKGKIVKERGNNGFGWDSIFQPNDSEKTYGEMSFEEKNEFSCRRLAVEKLKQQLNL